MVHFVMDAVNTLDLTTKNQQIAAFTQRLNAMEAQFTKVVQTVSVLQQETPGKVSVPIAQK